MMCYKVCDTHRMDCVREENHQKHRCGFCVDRDVVKRRLMKQMRREV